MNVVYDIIGIQCYYQLAWPPSIRRSAPVMYELAGLRRKTAAPLKSSGLLSLPSMF